MTPGLIQRTPVFACLAAFVCGAGLASDLEAYLRLPDSSFRWDSQGIKDVPGGRIHELQMVSQTWQRLEWEHELHVYEPGRIRYPDAMLLLVSGGRPRASSAVLGFQLAEGAGMRVAGLFQIPRQPLFDGKSEDALIAHTLVRYLETGDATWPLLFPMVKSAVRALDVLEAYSKQNWGRPVSRFIVAGASKRGWTSWLTAASGDPRVAAIAPVVIDTLNFPAQLKHQVASYGDYSEQIRDYVETGLVHLVDTEQGRRMWAMIDPYNFRDRLTLPKLIVNGTNDPYWTQDALNLYWDQLPGPKSVLYVPNATHSLREDLLRLVASTTAFCRVIASGGSLPELTWRHAEASGRMQLEVTPNTPARGGRLWFARSESLDFRQARWAEAPLRSESGKWAGEIDAPPDAFTALFGELEFAVDGRPYTLSTQIRIRKPGKSSTPSPGPGE